jgi:TolB-like protein
MASGDHTMVSRAWIKRAAGLTVRVVGLIALTVISARAQDLTRAASHINGRIANSVKTTAAVVDFTDLQMQVTELGRYLAEEFQAALVVEAKSYRIIDRTHLRSILQEHRLASSGVIDPATARQLGKIAGVEVLVTGSVTPFADSVRLTIKAIDASTAHVIGMVAQDIPRTGAISALISSNIGKEDATARRDTANTGKSSRTETAASASVRGVTVQIESCARRAAAVACRGWLTNASDDASFHVSARGSKLWDDQGNEYRLEKITIGNKELDPYFVTSVRLISGVRTPVVLAVDGAVSGAEFSRIVLMAEVNQVRSELTLRTVAIK